MTTRSLLAVDTNAREFGFALFHAGRLHDCRVMSLRRSRPIDSRLQVLERVFTHLLLNGRVDAVAFVKVIEDRYHGGLSSVQVLRAMDTIARRHGLSTKEFTPDTIRRAATGDATATMRMVARAICGTYPHLKKRLQFTQAWQERYYLRMFGAIATGLAYFDTAKDDGTRSNVT